MKSLERLERLESLERGGTLRVGLVYRTNGHGYSQTHIQASKVQWIYRAFDVGLVDTP